MRASSPYAHRILRAGLAFSLLYPPFAAIGDPVSWAAYFPSFVRHWPIDELLLLHAFGACEAVLALWILSGWRIRIPAVATAVLLIAIVAFNAAQFDVLFRDLSLAALAIALALNPRSRAE